MPGRLRYRCDRRWRLSRTRGKPGNRSNRHARTAITIMNRLNPIRNSTKDLILTVESLARTVSALRPRGQIRHRRPARITIDHERLGIEGEVSSARSAKSTDRNGEEGEGEEVSAERRCGKNKNALIPNLLALGNPMGREKSGTPFPIKGHGALMRAQAIDRESK
ncbi:hypothetical protein SAMN05444166_1102 [Singulisphaera sp. GP187]|nr:hypothetical protein SAMN05444166_1102 [Singulisphaera sp. GP187]